MSDRDSWCTPRAWAERVGAWDLDPCSNERSHIRATHTLRLDRGEDGLVADVRPGTRVFLNPPYGRGQVIQWVRRFAKTRFCFLVRLDPSTRWFAELYAASQVLLVPRGERIEFEPPPGVKASKNPYPHVLAYADHRDVTHAVETACFAWRCL